MNRWDLLGLTQEDRWNKRVLSNAEGHTYGCAEWKCHKEGFSGVANRASYVRHFEIKSLAFINMDKTLKRTMADELVSSIGIPINDEITLWEMSFLETAMHYTDYKKKADSTCKSGCRYYIDMVLRVVIADIKSMNSSKVESHVFTNNGDKSKSKIATSKVHNVDKECVQ
ncbi:MAG: hypothetical protein RBT40_10980 [Petrimonas sp.]|nr:hypothetical protein [Petrimonas sp.]